MFTVRAPSRQTKHSSSHILMTADNCGSMTRKNCTAPTKINLHIWSPSGDVRQSAHLLENGQLCSSWQKHHHAVLDCCVCCVRLLYQVSATDLPQSCQFRSFGCDHWHWGRRRRHRNHSRRRCRVGRCCFWCDILCQSRNQQKDGRQEGLPVTAGVQNWYVNQLWQWGILAFYFIALTSNIPTETACSSVSSQSWELEATYLNTRLNGILSQRRLAAIKAGGTSHMQLHLGPSECLVNCSLTFSLLL